MRNAFLGLMLTAGFALASEPRELQTMAKNATTPAAHSEVARGYRDWANTLEAKAVKHESNAERLAGDTRYNPMRHKWPAMAAAPAERERRLAMQARRAANEARALALKHEGLGEPKRTAAE